MIVKIKYLGTAAAEGFPALFCNCEFCRLARSLKGKNIRTRSQTIINDDLLIDFPPDSYSHFLKNSIEGDRIKYLLITHSHLDHLLIDDLELRSGAFFAHDMREPTLELYCGSGAHKKITGKIKNMPELSICEIKEFETRELGEYKVTALPARHYFGDGALIYIIEGDNTLLYAHDTGYFYDEVFEFIKKNNIKFDLVSLDCTNVDIPIDDTDTHMGLPNIRRVVKKLRVIGAVRDTTKLVINHFSHNACPLQNLLEEKVREDGFIVSYDGLEIVI